MILCGLCCAGKSTLGAALASRSNLPFYDTDRMLEAAHGKAPYALWKEHGGEAFRALESTIILSLNEPSVIAIGGGTLLQEKNRNHLKKLGPKVYLKASLSVIWERLQNRGIPAYLDRHNPFEHLKLIAEERIPIFESFCDYEFETDVTSDAFFDNFFTFFKSVSSIK